MQDFVNRLRINYPQLRSCYVAVIATPAHVWGWERTIEVEAGFGTIIGSYIPETGDVFKVKELAKLLQRLLELAGIKVYRTYAEWEESWSPANV